MSLDWIETRYATPGTGVAYSRFEAVRDSDLAPQFLCDSMLGGLARELRLAGYDAVFAGPIEDGELVRRAQASGEILLSSDAPLFERRILRNGTVRALFVPRSRPHEQVETVLRALELPVLEPRCLACGGLVVDVDKESVRALVPEQSFACFDEFYRCDRCGRVLWQGSHWDRIDARNRELRAKLEGE